MESSTATSPELLVNEHLSEAEKDFEGEGIATSVQEEGGLSEARKFDWNAHWYPVAVVADLDKRVPTAVRILARDLVVWWDKHGKTWQVWDDRCPHRLAPLSEGRINEKGELQCSYHGWCFAPCSGDCTCIPQASKDGNPVWKSKRASAAVYPSVAQEGILWFWPDTRPEFQGIMDTNPPPSLPALADLTFTDELASRNLNCGYEQLIENIMDPAHVQFAHHGLQILSQKGNRNMAVPINLKVDKLKNSGFTGMAARGPAVFTAPCIFTMEAQIPEEGSSKEAGDDLYLHPSISWPKQVYMGVQEKFFLMDARSDASMERKLEEAGSRKWETVCYVPTKSDAFVIAFRKWLRVYAGGQPDWNGRYDGLPPTPHRELLMDRYCTHVKLCRHCTAALKVFEGAGSFLQVVSVGAATMLGMAALKPSPQARSWSIPLAGGAVLATIASRWLSNFVKKTYHYHDYNHALVK